MTPQDAGLLEAASPGPEHGKGTVMRLWLRALSNAPKVSFVLICANRIQGLLEAASPDPSMAGALPPGAWWEYANTNSAMPIDGQPYGPNAGGQARKSCTLAFALRYLLARERLAEL